MSYKRNKLPQKPFLSVDSFLILSTILDFSTKKRRAIYSVKTAGSPYKTEFISDLYHDFDFYHLIFIYLACDHVIHCRLIKIQTIRGTSKVEIQEINWFDMDTVGMTFLNRFFSALGFHCSYTQSCKINSSNKISELWVNRRLQKHPFSLQTISKCSWYLHQDYVTLCPSRVALELQFWNFYLKREWTFDRRLSSLALIVYLLIFRCIFSLQGHTKAISSVKFSDDGHWLASASADRTVRIWNAVSNRIYKAIKVLLIL